MSTLGDLVNFVGSIAQNNQKYMPGSGAIKNFLAPSAQASTGDGTNWQPSQQAMDSQNSMDNLLYGNGTVPGVSLKQGAINAQNPTSGSGGKQTSGTKTKDTSGDLDKLRKNVKNQFSDVISNYSNQIGNLPGQQQDLLSNVDQLAGTQKGNISDALNAALAKLEGTRGQIADQQKTTLQDLAGNTRNLFQAGNVYLGTKGAGDSSATGMYSAALTQQANKQRGDVQKQVNDLNQNVTQQQTDTSNMAQQQLGQVDVWHDTQTQNIVMQYTDLKRQLEQAKTSASSQEKANLNNLDAQLYNAAKTQLYNLQNVAAQARTSLSSGVQSSATLGKAGADQIQNTTSAFKVGDVVQPDQIDISGLQAVDNQGSMWDKMSGNMYKKNDDGSFTYLGNQK